MPTSPGTQNSSQICRYRGKNENYPLTCNRLSPQLMCTVKGDPGLFVMGMRDTISDQVPLCLSIQNPVLNLLPTFLTQATIRQSKTAANLLA